ncbi:hypothetical protein EBB54_03215 [Schaedlerella arabinosiphila]|uniref:Uncharacterized protein n=1 Tax=Schaedlerella arabinosiphila TaxID=2044587 RepID=A0A426DCQ6_9FIRM|nr:hypothetical protein EBB54_03215 [Schaedlerella arabinosiphila]
MESFVKQSSTKIILPPAAIFLYNSKHGQEIIKFKILSHSSPGNMTHTDIKLFFCLQGEMQITCGDRSVI